MIPPCPNQTHGHGATFPKARTASEHFLSTRAESTKSKSDAAADPTMSARSSSTKQAYTTEIVKALFGDGDSSPIGDVVDDFSCSFQRQAGRLYVSTEGLFFFSNLFGFEKKIRINYKQALGITIARTTSLSVTTMEGEEFVFRSFENRENVLNIILSYYSNRGTEHKGAAPAPDSPLSSVEEAKPVKVEKSPDEMDNVNLVEDGPSSVPDLPNSIELNVSQNDAEKEKAESSSGVDSIKNMCEIDVIQWKELRQLAKGWEPVIANLKLNCKSSQDFFDLFLQEGAINSLLIFHRDVIGDKNIVIGAWKTSNGTTVEGKSISRKIEYEHKSAVSIAQVTRQQIYHCHGSNACLRNTTTIKGIKGVPSEAFFVEDIWFIESTKNKGIVLSVKFHVKFIKSTMLKSIIKRTATVETTEWYRQFSMFLRQKLHQRMPEDIAPIKTSSTIKDADLVEDLLSSARRIMPDLSAFLSQNAAMLLLAILTFMIYRLKQRVSALEEVVGMFERRLFELEKPPCIEIP